MSIDFQPWPKIARLNRDIIITEKIDGTNAAVVIIPEEATEDGFVNGPDLNRVAFIRAMNGETYSVYAQSRTRFITPGKSTDNYGFAGWVRDNAEALVETLGEGTHFGEWWGAGIQRGYGLKGGDKRFSLFNVKRWYVRYDHGPLEALSAIPGLGVVPVLYEGPFRQDAIDAEVRGLRFFGSRAKRGFSNPEGIVVFHTASRESYKVTLEGDEAPKGAAGHALDNERIAA